MVAGMVRTVVVRKRSIIIYGIIIIVLAFITVILTTYLQGNKDNGYITYARAAKMVAYAQVDDCDAFISDGDWYKPYIDYVNVNGYMYAASPNFAFSLDSASPLFTRRTSNLSLLIFLSNPVKLI